MEKKIKILAIGDLHGDTGLAKKLAEKARKENVDLVIIAGDITHFERSTKNLIGPFVKEKKPVLLIHGNHEALATVDFLSQLYPSTKNLHGYSFSKGDVGIFGCGGADFGISPMSEKDFFKTLKKAHEGIKGKKTKIMVTHMHPHKSKAEFSGFRGSKGIKKAIKDFKPDLLISGHIHEAEGIEEKIGKTRIINIGKKGKIIEI
ncbi:MAG: metallophosphoesterase [archaeon]